MVLGRGLDAVICIPVVINTLHFPSAKEASERGLVCRRSDSHSLVQRLCVDVLTEQRLDKIESISAMQWLRTNRTHFDIHYHTSRDLIRLRFLTPRLHTRSDQ